MVNLGEDYTKLIGQMDKEWVYSGSTVALQRTKDERKTNKRRTKDEKRTRSGRREGGFKRKLLTTY